MKKLLSLNNTLLIPWVVALIGILILTISIFLPYMTADGELSDYINTHSDVIAIEDSDVTLGDFQNVPFLSVSKLVKSIWGEGDAEITDIFLIVLGVFAILITLFVLFKKPILAMICDILTCGTFLFLNALLEDLIGNDKYLLGIGYYAILFALIVIFIGSILMLIFKIIQKKQQCSAKTQL